MGEEAERLRFEDLEFSDAQGHLLPKTRPVAVWRTHYGTLNFRPGIQGNGADLCRSVYSPVNHALGAGLCKNWAVLHPLLERAK